MNPVIRNSLKILAAFLLVAALLVPYVPVLAKKGPVSDEIYFKWIYSDASAMLAVKSGEIDWHYWRVPPAMLDEMRKDPNIKLLKNPLGGMYSLLLNPAPNAGGKFNPFAIKKFRFAFHYLVNRKGFVNDILKGEGAPAVAAVTPFDYDYKVISDEIDQLGIMFDKGKAFGMMADALIKAGAVKKGKLWYYNGKPIEVNFFIRIDDPIRHQFGDSLANLIEEFGIKVNRIYADARKAFFTVYFDDPAKGEWHLYTEGWGGGLSKYKDYIPAQMYSPWYGYMPGWAEPTYWNYKNDELDELSQKLFLGQYKSETERNELMRKSILLGIEEAVRIFVAVGTEYFAARKEVKDIIIDFGYGAASKWAYMSAYKPGSKTLYVGAKFLTLSAWQPIGGLTWYYDVLIWRAITDPALDRHPHSGEVLPWRANFTVEYNYVPGEGPKDIDVPEDAMKWDPVQNKWVKVGRGVKAKSKVTFNYLFGKWHDGTPMSMADILYSFYISWEWSSDESEPGKPDPYYDPDVASNLAPYMETVKGFRIINDTAIEVYVDYWHFDKNEIADYAVFWASMPWHVIAAMEKLVVDGKYAFGESSSAARGVDQIDPIQQPHAMDIKAALESFDKDNFIPPALSKASGVPFPVGEKMAKTAYENAMKFIEAHKHAVICNGPFILDEYNPTSLYMHLVANRDYPFSPEKWLGFREAKFAEIAGITVNPIIDKAQGAEVEVRVLVGGKPSSEAEVYYKIVSAGLLTAGKIVAKGKATPGDEPGVFIIKLTPGMLAATPAGPAEIKVSAISKYSTIWAFAIKDVFITGQASLDLSAAAVIGGTPVYGSDEDLAAAEMLRSAFGLNAPVKIAAYPQAPEGNLFVVGGPKANKAAETLNKVFGVEFKYSGSSTTISVGGKSDTVSGADYGKKDIAVVLIGETAGRKVVLVEGATRFGTQAAATFLAEKADELTGATWALLSWVDQNGDGAVQIDEISVTASG